MAGGRAKTLGRWAVAVAILCLLAVFGPSIVNNPVALRTRFTVMPDRERDESSGLVRIFRELQFSLADICYNKSTLYMHKGIRYAQVEEAPMSERIRKGSGGSEDPNETTGPSGSRPDERLSQDVKPWIPPKEIDFRGIIGDVEREVKPTTTTHARHVKEEEALPWMRLATLLNPRHEKAWMGIAASMIQKRGDAATSDAVAILELAAKVNPLQDDKPYNMYGLQWQLAHYYYLKANQKEHAIDILLRAIDRGEKDFARLDAVQQDWLSFCVRDCIQFLRRTGRLDEAIAMCRRGIALYSEDGTMRRTLIRLLRQKDDAVTEKKSR